MPDYLEWLTRLEPIEIAEPRERWGVEEARERLQDLLKANPAFHASLAGNSPNFVGVTIYDTAPDTWVQVGWIARYADGGYLFETGAAPGFYEPDVMTALVRAVEAAWNGFPLEPWLSAIATRFGRPATIAALRELKQRQDLRTFVWELTATRGSWLASVPATVSKALTLLEGDQPTASR